MIQPIIIKPFSQTDFTSIKQHATDKRKSFEGTPYHDKDFVQWKMNRWGTHNDPLLVEMHEKLVPIASEIFKEPVKKSYVYLSMYGDQGIVQKHTDRPMCKYTIDLCIDQGQPWELFVNGKPYLLNEGDALCYSGTDSPHYRNKIQEGNFANLAFFHFVPVDYEGGLD
jgi:hypothetical protein